MAGAKGTGIARLLAGWWLAGLTLAAGCVYVIMLTVTLPELQRMSGGLSVFDLRPAGYDLDEALAVLESLGTEGRTYYRTRQLPLDAVYPGLLAASLAGFWLLATRALGLTTLRWRRLAWLAVGTAAFDYAENLAVLVMLLRFPAVDGGLVSIASAFTVIKSVVASVCFTGLLVVGGLVLWRRWRAKDAIRRS